MTFRQRLKQARENAQITQGALGGLVGVSKQEIARWEGGREPALGTITKLAEALNVTPCWLAFGDQPDGRDAGVAAGFSSSTRCR